MLKNISKISGHIVDIEIQNIFSGVITINDGIITNIEKTDNVDNQYILPGFIDSHIHIESSMLVPSEFAKAAVPHGVIACLADPHEIANVTGVKGIDFMIENASKANFHFFFGCPSCVPATDFETNGANFSSSDIEKIINRKDIYFLSEMMNYPGVINGDEEVLRKIEHAQNAGKPIDGHAPNLSEPDTLKYISAGISTDHECYTIEDALFKIKNGMKVIIRDGSAARNFQTLLPLLSSHSDNIMFCSDDKHPDELLNGYINNLVKDAVNHGYNVFDTLKAASVNPVKHYKLPVGLLKQNDSADFIVVDNLKDFNIKKTVIKGKIVFENGLTYIQSIDIQKINNFDTNEVQLKDLKIENRNKEIKVIKINAGELYTNLEIASPLVVGNEIVSDVSRDILKIVVKNRYHESECSIGFVKGFGLKNGALASTVAHDSHNLICVGTNDEDMQKAMNEIINHKGGISISANNKLEILPLPIAGIISDKDAKTTAEKYKQLNSFAKDLGCIIEAPFMTLAFMSLLVIPEIKLGDKGLFDVSKFEFTDLFI